MRHLILHLGEVADVMDSVLLIQVVHRCGTHRFAAGSAHEFEGNVRVVVFDDALAMSPP